MSLDIFYVFFPYYLELVKIFIFHVKTSSYTLSHPGNTCDVSVCYRGRNLCIFSCIQKGTPGLTHKGCVLQHVFSGALSDVTVVLGMRQSIHVNSCYFLISWMSALNLASGYLWPNIRKLVCFLPNIIFICMQVLCNKVVLLKL